MIVIRRDNAIALNDKEFYILVVCVSGVRQKYLILELRVQTEFNVAITEWIVYITLNLVLSAH